MTGSFDCKDSTIELHIVPEPGSGEANGDEVSLSLSAQVQGSGDLRGNYWSMSAGYAVRAGVENAPIISGSFDVLTGTPKDSGSKILQVRIGDTVPVTISFNGNADFAPATNSTTAPSGQASLDFHYELQSGELKPDTFSWNADHTAVQYQYQVVGGPLPAASGVGVYWSSSQDLSGQLGVVEKKDVPAGTVPGTYGPFTIAASALIDPPRSATYLVFATDPNHTLGPEPGLRSVVLSDVWVVGASWNTGPAGGLSCEVAIGGVLPQAATIDYYWSPDATFSWSDARAGDSSHTDGTTGITTRSLAGGAMTVPPPGTNYLLVVADAFDFIKEAREDNNVFALPLNWVSPTITLQASPQNPEMGVPYDVAARVTNVGPFPLQLTADWDETYLTTPPPVETARQGRNVDLGRVDPGQTVSRSLPEIVPFQHLWDWIERKTPVTLTDALKDIDTAALEATGRRILDALVERLGSVLNVLRAKDIWDVIDKLATPVYSSDVDYFLTAAYGGPGPRAQGGVTVSVTVPELKRGFYLACVGTSALASVLLGNVTEEGLFGNVLETRQALAAGVLSLATAWLSYQAAMDPPDASFREIAGVQALSVPELEGTPAGVLKDFAQTMLQVEALKLAEVTSLNRARGAADAGDTLWQSRQLLAAADFASRQAALLNGLLGQQMALEATLAAVPPFDPAAATRLREQGLPPLAVRLLEERGWAAEAVQHLAQNLADLDPAVVNTPGLVSGTLRLQYLASAAAAFESLQQALDLRVHQLGQAIRDLTADERAALDSARAEITAQVAQSPTDVGVADKVAAFLAEVERLALATNNAEAVSGDLDFGYMTLARQQQALAAEPNVLIATSPLLALPTVATIFTPNAADAPSAFVCGLYRSLLGRDANPNLTDPSGAPFAEYQFWTPYLDAGASRAEVAWGVWNSVEQRGRQVDAYYHTFLHREAELEGRAAWVNVLLSGVDDELVVQAFLASPEYQQLHAGNAEYVRALYRDLLRRDAEDLGLGYWTGQLEAGTSRDAVALGILRSDESYLRAVQSLYTGLLRRHADDSEQAAWMARLTSEEMSCAEALRAFLASEEFWAGAVRNAG
jgi:hypothetical protein